jgi:hypothetical protein
VRRIFYAWMECPRCHKLVQSFRVPMKENEVRIERHDKPSGAKFAAWKPGTRTCKGSGATVEVGRKVAA